MTRQTGYCPLSQRQYQLPMVLQQLSPITRQVIRIQQLLVTGRMLCALVRRFRCQDWRHLQRQPFQLLRRAVDSDQSPRTSRAPMRGNAGLTIPSAHTHLSFVRALPHRPIHPSIVLGPVRHPTCIVADQFSCMDKHCPQTGDGQVRLNPVASGTTTSATANDSRDGWPASATLLALSQASNGARLSRPPESINNRHTSRCRTFAHPSRSCAPTGAWNSGVTELLYAL